MLFRQSAEVFDSPGVHFSGFRKLTRAIGPANVSGCKAPIFVVLDTFPQSHLEVHWNAAFLTVSLNARGCETSLSTKPALSAGTTLTGIFIKIFERVLEVYLDAKQAQPFGSSLCLLDSTLRYVTKRWTPDTAHTEIDFENAVKKALANDVELQEKFPLWFLCAEGERPEFRAGDMVLYNRLIRKCAGEFLRRGMFPIWKWFRSPQKQQKDFQDAEIGES